MTDNIQIQVVKAKNLSHKNKKEFMQDRYNLGVEFYEQPDDTEDCLNEIENLFNKDNTYFVMIELCDKKFGSLLGSFSSDKRLFNTEYIFYDNTISLNIIKTIIQKLKITLHIDNIYGIVDKHAGGFIGYVDKIALQHSLLFGEDPNVYIGFMI